MSISRGTRWLGLALAVALAACSPEVPLGIGSDLTPIEVVSFDVVLPADVFMAEYHTFAGFISPREVGYGIVATDLDGDVEVRTLARFPAPPSQITFVDTQGSTRTDTMPTFPSGRLVVVTDTLLSGEASVTLSLYRTGEAWDPVTASWELRIDSIGDRQPWSTPGGTLGELISQASYSPHAEDSLSIPVDSQTIAIWADTENPARGAVLLAESAGARVRIKQLALHLNARPSARPDTLVEVTTSASAMTFVASEATPQPGALHVGGVPAWRSFLRFADGLDTLTVCGGSPERCHRLSDVSVNYAALVVRPIMPRGDLFPDDTLHVQARGLSVSPLVPLERSPLRERLNPFSRPTVQFAPVDFDVPDGALEFEIPMTSFVSNLVRARNEPVEQRHIALVAVPEGHVFGEAAFRAEGEHAPTLRLVISAMEEKEAP